MKSWLSRLIGRPSIDWPYPFAEGKQFVLTIIAGLEGYHINVDGRHITSFPYRTVSSHGTLYSLLNCSSAVSIFNFLMAVNFFAWQGYNLEDATELSLKGDLDVESVFVAHLPSSPPSFSPQSYLEMSEQWKASPLPTEPVELFIGILSAANHFSERMAVRKSWMISTRRSSNVVARFFVSLVSLANELLG